MIVTEAITPLLLGSNISSSVIWFEHISSSVERITAMIDKCPPGPFRHGPTIIVKRTIKLIPVFPLLNGVVPSLRY